MRNPFIYRAYTSKEFFCDREQELKILLSHSTSNVDTTLISERRMGKTGLIHRLFDEVKDLNIDILPIYVDIFSTCNLADFIKVLSENILRAVPDNSSLGEKLLKFIKSLRPMVTYDALSGVPQFQINYQNEPEKIQTLYSLFDILNSVEKPVLLAIDEFQQIRNYPEGNMEALLRTHIQTLSNVNFIFCGSKRHLMLDIFANERAPFYRSTEFLALDKISEQSYSDFINRQFASDNRTITPEAIEYILEWTRRHTYYTQRLCHYVFQLENNTIDIQQVKESAQLILQADSTIFNQYRQMLTDKQWRLLVAVAKEGEVEQPTSRKFIQQYALPSASTIQSLLPILVEKEVLTETLHDGNLNYRVSDIFFSHWLSLHF